MKSFVKKEYLITTLVILFLWQLLAIAINNDVIIPMPFNVLVQTTLLFSDYNFYLSLGFTLLRVIKGCGLSLLAALVIALLGYRIPAIKHYFAPVFLITKTIPNISYIIICLIWFGANNSVTVVCFLILFPMLYSNITKHLEQFESSFGDILKIYYEKFYVLLYKNLIPYLCPFILSDLKTTLSLGFKVCVMAEILGQVKYGIGKQLYLAKMNLDMTNLFAYTLIIIIVCLIIDIVFDSLLHIEKLGGK